MPEARITLDATLHEILTAHPETAAVMITYRMRCIGCYLSPFATLESALRVHGLPEVEVLEALNRAIGWESSQEAGWTPELEDEIRFWKP